MEAPAHAFGAVSPSGTAANGNLHRAGGGGRTARLQIAQSRISVMTSTLSGGAPSPYLDGHRERRRRVNWVTEGSFPLHVNASAVVHLELLT